MSGWQDYDTAAEQRDLELVAGPLEPLVDVDPGDEDDTDG